MDEPDPTPLAKSTQGDTPAEQPAIARGSGQMSEVPPVPHERSERTEHSVMEGLPAAKAERVAAMRRELAELQRQLIDAQQRIATELQGRADDAERFEALEARLQAQELAATALQTEITELRSQLVSATATAEELGRDVAARDAQIEAQTTSLHEAKALLQARDAELATRAAEHEAEQTTRSRLERELEDQRKQHRDAIDQLEAKLASARDEKELLETRDAELAAMTAQRDALAGEHEKARRELETSRAKLRDVATDLVRLGQALVDGTGISQPGSHSEPTPANAPPSARRPQPPPLPAPRAAAHAEQPVETILEVIEEPKPATSRVRSGLLMLLGIAVGCAVTISVMKASSSSSTAAGYRQDLGAPPSADLTQPLAPETASPPPVEPVADPAAASEQPAPATDEAARRPEESAPRPEQPAPASATDETARPQDESAPRPEPPAEVATEGVILLPPSAEGHRVYVDGRIVRVKSSKAVVRCGTRKVRIGSSGTERAFDIECGGETAIAAETRDR